MSINCCIEACNRIIDYGPLGTMCFYLKKWHSRLAILFGYTSVALITMILLVFGGCFGGPFDHQNHNATTDKSTHETMNHSTHLNESTTSIINKR
ncbi:hypothetical protein BLOT_015086 [Blomia tropicalis]|nr:hypothetical protein BLOT_015086 [Blomia tropicalis]